MSDQQRIFNPEAMKEVREAMDTLKGMNLRALAEQFQKFHTNVQILSRAIHNAYVTQFDVSTSKLADLCGSDPDFTGNLTTAEYLHCDCGQNK